MCLRTARSRTMIKIITGYSGPGGSTLAFKALCDAFNNLGIDAEMYGPHDWHLKFGSKYKRLFDYIPKKEHKLITHFLDFKQDVSTLVDTIIYSCHEMWWFNFANLRECYDKVHFLTQEQADYHSSVKNYFLLPNLRESIKISRKKTVKNIAGVIGSIEPRKDTEAAIKKALSDDCSQVLLFGSILDPTYYEERVKPLVDDLRVRYMGHKEKSEIYSMIDRVYHMSTGEVASLVMDECFTTDTLFIGNGITTYQPQEVCNDDIIKTWLQELDIK